MALNDTNIHSDMGEIDNIEDFDEDDDDDDYY